MALNFVSVTRKDQGRGLDSFSAKSAIPDGYAQDLKNVDTNANGKLETRKGYEGYAGWVPFRVSRVESSGTSLRFQFATSQSIDLTNTDLGPLVVYGRLSDASSGSGDFTTSGNSVRYYPTFVIASKVTLTAGSHTLTYTAAQHGFSSANLMVGLTELTGSDTSNQSVIYDDLEIDPSSFEVTLDYTRAAAAAADGQVYFKDLTADPGNIYVFPTPAVSGTFTADAGTDVLTAGSHTIVSGEQLEFTTTGTLPTGLALATRYYARDVTATTFKVAATEGGAALDLADTGSGTHTWNRRSYRVPTSTHGLNNFNILVEAHDTAGATDIVVIPAGWTIDLTGQVEVVFDSAFTGNLYLIAAPNDQSSSTTASTGAQTFDIVGPGDSLLFLQAYRYNSTTARYESVLVDGYTYTESTDTLTVSYTLAASGTESVEFYWVSGQTIANAIEVEAGTSATYSDDTPQLTVWGIDHEGTYRDADLPGGHVTHLDTYRRAAEARLVCGLGGNLFKAATFAEAAETYLFGGPLYTNLRARVDAVPNIALAPLFWATNPGSVRTRGVVYDTNVSADNYARVTAATYVSSGVVDYTLSWAGKTGAINTSAVLATSDYLTVRNLSRPEHTGEFQILSVQADSSTETVIRVTNSGVTNASFNVTGARGQAGVFTDTFSTEVVPNWLPGDFVVVPNLYENLDLEIQSVTSTTVYVSGVTESVVLSDGTLLFATRTSTLVPLRDTDNVSSVVNLVRGDMLVATVGGDTLARRVRVVGVQPQTTQDVTLAFAGGTATGTTVSAHYLSPGDRIVLREHPTLTGEHVVLTVPSLYTFTITAATNAQTTASLQGNMVELDEALDLADGDQANEFYVESRWVPLEAPPSVDDLPATTYYRHLDTNDYSSQPAARSTLLNDAMYFVNGDDEVWKFDGEYLQRAGLPKWQAGLFAQNDTSASAVLSVGPEVELDVVNVAGKSLLVSIQAFAVGDRLYNPDRAQFATVRSVGLNPNASDQYELIVLPDDDISTWVATDSIRKVVTYKYYVRLNLVDVNGYVVSSAAVNSEDLVLDYASAGAIQLKLVTPPAFGALDYDRVELEVYRTASAISGGVPGVDFYLHTRQLVTFDAALPYILLTDSLTDSVINRQENTDALTKALVPAPELGTGWDQPPRAKHLTSLGGRLILGNLRGWPEAVVSFKPAVGASAVLATDLAGDVFTIRKDSTSSSTTTNLTDVVRYEFVGGTPVTITPATDITRTATTFTVADAAHTLVAGDWVYMFHSVPGTANSLQFAGWWQISSVVAGTSWTVTATNTATVSSADVDRYVRATVGTDIPVWIGNSGTDGNYNQRDGNTTGDSEELPAALRLANAVNASMRATTTADFEPWLTAFAGNDYPGGTVVLRVPVALDTTPELVVPTTAYQVFVNNELQAGGDQPPFRTALFPSRLVRSYPNYPEIFDNPFAATEDSDSVIDVNPADGQEIQGVIPVFGSSATGSASQQSQELAVFKTNSVYLVNPETRVVTRLETRGLGCNAPRSIAPTKDGIAFANPSGVFRLNRDNTITQIGLNLTGLWRDSVNKPELAQAHGHHYAFGRRYKLSVPTGTAGFADQVYVYDYDREGEDQAYGAWTRYEDHAAVGWCNLDDSAYWASQSGDVFLVRERGEASDYRDEAEAIQAVVTLRAEDFDLPGVRKAVAGVTSVVELELTDLSGLQVEVAQNLSSTFQVAESSVDIARSAYQQRSFHVTPPTRRGNFIQVRYTHEQLDEAFVLVATSYDAAQLTTKNIPEGSDQ